MIEIKEAIEVIENALSFYAEEGISSDEKAQKELDDAWNIVKEKKNYGYGYDETNSVVIIWEVEDVRSVIEQNDLPLKLDDDQCMEVLGYVESNHDACLGITWDSIYYAIQNIYEDELKEANKEVANA